MGLEGAECERMESFNQLANLVCGPVPMDKNSNGSQGFCMDMDTAGDAQLQILMQAQALLKKNVIFGHIDAALRAVSILRPCVQNLANHSEEDDVVTRWHRDAAANNLRFLNIFYGYNASCFALSVNLLDRILGKVKAHPRYLSCIAMSCFYIAIKNQATGNVAGPAELVKLSQCGGTDMDLIRMERLVLEKLGGSVQSPTPTTFLQMFAEVLAVKVARFDDPDVMSLITAKLDVLMCQFEFAKFRAETLALALLSCVVQDMNLLADMDLFTAIIELQYHCQISDVELLGCRGLILDFLAAYGSAPARVPRLRLVWSVSRRTLSKMKPSTRILLDLEPIMEDEDQDEDTEDDSGQFDSEGECESVKGLNNNYLIRPHPEILRKMAAERSSKQQAVIQAKPTLPDVAKSTSAMLCENSSEQATLQHACSQLSFITLHSEHDDNDHM